MTTARHPDLDPSAASGSDRLSPHSPFQSSTRSRLLRGGAALAGGALLVAGLPALAANASSPGKQTFYVTTTADAGTGSLRSAITRANATPVADTIAFRIPGSGVRSIRPASALPEITAPVTVDGYSQPGSSRNSLHDGSNAQLKIEINGSATPAANGLVLAAGSDRSTVQGLVLNGFRGTVVTEQGNGLLVRSSGNRVLGNFLGTSADGGKAQGNETSGVLIRGKSNVVGTNALADRNVISGNGNSVNLPPPVPSTTAGVLIREVGADGNRVNNNVVGPGARGNQITSSALPVPTLVQNVGVQIELGAKNNVVGATTTCDRGNVISGNATRGVVIQLPGTTGNSVSRNRIGTNLAGTGPLPGATTPEAVQDTGVQISGDARYDSIGVGPRTTAGGLGATSPGFGNTIWFNDDDGVLIGGTNRAASDFTDGHLIRFNSFRNNGGVDGIGLGINGDSGIPATPSPFEATPGLGTTPYDRNVTNLDDPLDPDTGPNNEPNLVTVDSAVWSSKGTRVKGHALTEPNATFLIDIYADRAVQPLAPLDPRPATAADPSGYGEGEFYVGSFSVTTNALGVLDFDRVLTSSHLVKGAYVTATTTKTSGGATDLLPADAGDFAGQLTQPPNSTSEFGKDAPVS